MSGTGPFTLRARVVRVAARFRIQLHSSLTCRRLTAAKNLGCDKPHLRPGLGQHGALRERRAYL
jgi:hypothetical protein